MKNELADESLLQGTHRAFQPVMALNRSHAMDSSGMRKSQMPRGWYLLLAALAAFGGLASAEESDIQSKEITVTEPTTLSGNNSWTCNKLVVLADLTLDGPGIVVSNGFPNASITMGGDGVETPVLLTATNDARIITRPAVTVSVRNHGGQFRVSGNKTINPDWGKQVTDDFWGSCWNGFNGSVGYDLSFNVDEGIIAGENGYLDLTWLGPKGILGCGGVENRSTGVPVRLLFDGGCIYHGKTVSTGAYFRGAEGSKIVLEGMNGNAIFLRNCYVSDTLSDGIVKLVTTGKCDFVWGGGNLTRGTQTLADDVDWAHEGNIVLCGWNNFKVGRDNFFPYGANAGNLCLTALTNGFFSTGDSVPGATCLLDLNGKTINVNSFYGLGNVTGEDRTYVTNMLDNARGSIIVGAQVEDSQLTGVFCGLVDVRKQGKGTVTIGIRKTRFENGAAFYLDEGKAIFKNELEALGKLVLAAGTELVVDGIQLEADVIENHGGTVTCINGGTLVMVKRGEAELLLHNADRIGGNIRVAKGRLTLNGSVSTNEFWRMSFSRVGMGLKPHQHTELGRIVLLDDVDITLEYSKYPTEHAQTTGLILSGGTKRIGQTWNSGALTNVVFDTVPTAKDLVQGSMTLAADKSWAEGKSGRVWCDPSCLFKSDSFNDIVDLFSGSDYDWAQSPNIEINKPNTHPQVILRLAAGKNRVKAYSMLEGGWNAPEWMPDSWILETSADGVVWETADVQTGVPPACDYDEQGTQLRGGSWYQNGKPFEISNALHLNDAAGLGSDANLQVDSEAIFDGSYATGGVTEVSHLTLNTAFGAGTLKGVRLAAEGTLNILNATGKILAGDLGWTFDATVAQGDLSGWSVYVNGVQKGNYALHWENGRLHLMKPGLVLVVQ